MLFKILVVLILSTGFVIGIPRKLIEKTNQPKKQNGEPCDWFIDLLQKRRLNREAKVPMILEDVTEEPKEYEKYNYSAPLEFAGDHLSEKEPEMIGCGLAVDTTTTTTQKPSTPKSIEPCALPSTSPEPKSTNDPLNSLTTEEPCEEKRGVDQENKNLLAKRKETVIKEILALRMSSKELGRNWQKQYGRKVPEKLKSRMKRSHRGLRKNFKKCKTSGCEDSGHKPSTDDCANAKDNSPTERILLEANVHIGEGFEELLLDMLTPGDKTIKIAEQEETDKVPQMRWEVTEDEAKK